MPIPLFVYALQAPEDTAFALEPDSGCICIYGHAFLGNSVFRDSGVLKNLPVPAILLIWLFLVIYTTAAVVSEMRQAKDMHGHDFSIISSWKM